MKGVEIDSGSWTSFFFLFKDSLIKVKKKNKCEKNGTDRLGKLCFCLPRPAYRTYVTYAPSFGARAMARWPCSQYNAMHKFVGVLDNPR